MVMTKLHLQLVMFLQKRLEILMRKDGGKLQEKGGLWKLVYWVKGVVVQFLDVDCVMVLKNSLSRFNPFYLPLLIA
jgi:hypothetical protein